jgi:hypothetical protein
MRVRFACLTRIFMYVFKVQAYCADTPPAK